MDKNISKINLNEDADLLDLFRKIKTKINIIYSCLITAFLLAIIIVLLTPKQYKTEISLLAETNSKKSTSGIFGQLGGLSGLDMGGLMGLDMNGSDALTPDLYPKVVKSTSFLSEILNSEIIEPKSNTTVTVSKYLRDFTKPSVWGIGSTILHWFKSKKDDDLIIKKSPNQPLKLSQTQTNLIKSLSDIITINVIKSGGGGLTGGDSKIINVSVEIQDPLISALLAEMVVNNLKHYIINYNTGKVKKDLEFIEARYIEAQSRYYKTQEALADYDDSHINVILSSARTDRQRLETENSLASSLYNGLAQKLEQSKIMVQDKTPVFTEIEPAKIPLRKSKPKSTFIVISMLLIGGFVGVTIILGKEFLESFRNKSL